MRINAEPAEPAEDHVSACSASSAFSRPYGLLPVIRFPPVWRTNVVLGVEYVLAGSIRDDGPLPDTIMDLVEAQNRYAKALDGVSMVLILSSMLHGIGVGNMLPSAVRTVCVDINPAVVTKLADRGSSQTVGIVTDSGLFLRQLVEQLRA